MSSPSKKTALLDSAGSERVGGGILVPSDHHFRGLRTLAWMNAWAAFLTLLGGWGIVGLFGAWLGLPALRESLVVVAFLLWLTFVLCFAATLVLNGTVLLFLGAGAVHFGSARVGTELALTDEDERTLGAYLLVAAQPVVMAVLWMALVV